LAENTSDWIWEVDPKGVYTYSNHKVTELLGYESEELIGKTPFDLMPMDEAKRVSGLFNNFISSQSFFNSIENVNIHKNGSRVVMETSAVPIFSNKGEFLGYRGIDRDITSRKHMEEALKRSRETLEEKVKERTSELEDINIALKVLLKKGENDKKEIEEKIFSNYKSLISPFIEKLKNRLTEKNQKNLMYIIESNMQKFFKPFSKKISDQMAKLTPAEIQIASMIKEGLSNKEIAQILNNSVRTITNHRQHIRRKFDLENKKVNLRSYLSSL